MTNKYKMGTQELESINAELFESFDAEQELWIIGGSTLTSSTSKITYAQGVYDGGMDFDVVF